MASSDTKVTKVQSDFHTLSEIASSLNAASDELTKTVTILDESLKKLNVGLSVWVSFRSRADEDTPYIFDEDQIGYCKVNGTWGIALRRIWGNETLDGYSEDGPWLFNDASREMRLLSVDQIPGVIEALAKEAFNTTTKIQEKTKKVRELAEAIAPFTDQTKGKSLTIAESMAAGHKSAVDIALKSFQRGVTDGSK